MGGTVWIVWWSRLLICAIAATSLVQSRLMSMLLPTPAPAPMDIEQGVAMDDDELADLGDIIND